MGPHPETSAPALPTPGAGAGPVSWAVCPASAILVQGEGKVTLICVLDAGHLAEHYHRFFNLHWWKGENGA